MDLADVMAYHGRNERSLRFATLASADDQIVAPGLPAADLDRLFAPFTRLDDRTRHEGFGLGRALVASIAARPAHRGP